ncbi:glycosyltransferase involved in cell wall biosynthesis [Natronocella acetinitrilica]|uniref:Glycosyltransferase involved in cell wall biosynthesis n=1 Tax=Natronocella acetinitrilica TaxID=414046 RepID=A0AAE3G7B6_9GAMM|nr:glycosyltransferase family 4 protein [Natronocella acetinitrilica]MCP1677146.1 glycosyltransferase involved in cell wall biosynthesis [Natronocella acetinitrilica]
MSTAAIYCDCNSQGGVFSYTIRMLALFRSWGWKTLLISHTPRANGERETSAILCSHADQHVLVDSALSNDSQVNRIENILKRTRPDVFIPNYRKLPWAAAARASRRQAISVMGVCHSDHESYYTGGLMRYAPIISLYACPSRKTERELRARLPARHHAKIRYIPHYVERTTDGYAAFDPDRFTVVYHGRLREEQKHVSEIIEIANRVCAESESIHFKLIGDSQEGSLYSDLIARNGLTDRVSLLPPTDWAGIQQELANSQLSILTSEYEGFCYTAAEALSVGLPVFAYNCGDVISDFVKTKVNGFVAPWGDRELIADNIRTLANEPEHWRSLSAEALNTAQTVFDFHTVSQLYKEGIENVNSAIQPWPRLRPTYIPDRGKSLRSFIDKSGRRLSFWE